MVRNSSTCIQILLTSAKLNNSTPSDSVNISNHYLPPECGDNNHRCDILHFESSEFSYYIIPSIRGFVVLSHGANNIQDLQTSFINITEKCNPLQAFYAGPEGRNHIVVACMDLQTRPRGILYYLQYRFSPSNTGRGSIIRNTELLTLSEAIYNPETVSKVVYVRGQQRCAEYDNLYFIDDAYVVHYPSDAFDPEFISSNHALQNCIGYESIEYYGSDDLLIRCSNNQTIIYDSCASRFTYQLPDRVPYPCSNWEDVAYRNGSQLTLQSINNRHAHMLTLPFSDLTFGKCVQDGNYSTFIAQSADGVIFIAPFGGGVINISSDNCFTKGNKMCHKPVFSENEQVFGVFESATDTLTIVNLTQTCKQQPNVINIHAPFTPELISISQGKRVRNCSCSEMRPQPFDYTIVTAAQGISTKEDVITQPQIPLTTLIPVGVAMGIVVIAILVGVLAIT